MGSLGSTKTWMDDRGSRRMTQEDHVARSYDHVASRYAACFCDELERKAFDRLMLDWLIDRTRGGTLCDLGCGPGHVAAYLARRASSIVGVDISSEMIREARARHRGIAFYRASMLDLDGTPKSAFSGVACFYSIIHLEKDQLREAFTEMHRVLTPKGWLLLAFHVGDERRHVGEFLGETVDLDFQFFLPAEVRSALEKAGFRITEALLREPYAGAEIETQRAYIWAQRSQD